MEESVDVKALRAKFNSKVCTSDASSRDGDSPKSPQPCFGKVILPLTESNLSHHRLAPKGPLPPSPSPGLARLPMEASVHPRPPAFPRPPAKPGTRASLKAAEPGKVKLKGEMLQSLMQLHHRPPGAKPAATAPGLSPAAFPSSAPLPLRQQPRQRSAGEVTPLRKPLPPERPLPLKPKRPPFVNLEPYQRFIRGPAHPAPRKNDAGPPVSAGRKMSLPAVVSPPKPPQRCNKPVVLPQHMSIDNDHEFYDDIASFEKNESCSDNSSHCMEGEDDDLYEFIDEDQVDKNRSNAEKLNKKEPSTTTKKSQQAQDKINQMQRRKEENELKKKFKLQGEVEVLHTARVRHDWHGGGKLDLSIRQGESVEILRVKNNPEGKWLARSLDGHYGYISNTSVDVDYEAVKRKLLNSRKTNTSQLPPPPPDPPMMVNVKYSGSGSTLSDDDYYDDVEPMTEDFPPPPPEISIEPKVEKELRKRFKYEGPLRVLHTMMVDPNGIIKKPGGKDLHVTQGEIVDIIQLTNSKKALCCNQFGKYGFVSRSLLLTMEGDIYDDVDYPNDVYDNDS
ncbi:uncharacterized protein LOC120823596 isoform X3 [Gasterosteus aculeatus]